MSCRFKCFKNCWCFALGKGFVSPSASIFVLSTQIILMFRRWTSCRSHSRLTSICRMFVFMTGLSMFMSRTVCLLSHSITLSGCSRSKPMALNKCVHPIVSFAACCRASNSASVVDVVTVFCFLDFQSIGPPNILNTYPSVDRKVPQYIERPI